MMHTPGPWKTEFVDSDLSWNVVDANGKDVIGMDGFWRGDESDKANAILCAAAPEMLEMLVELQQCAQYWSEYDVPIGIVDRLNAIISKAKGDSHGESDQIG